MTQCAADDTKLVQIVRNWDLALCQCSCVTATRHQCEDASQEVKGITKSHMWQQHCSSHWQGVARTKF